MVTLQCRGRYARSGDTATASQRQWRKAPPSALPASLAQSTLFQHDQGAEYLFDLAVLRDSFCLPGDGRTDIQETEERRLSTALVRLRRYRLGLGGEAAGGRGHTRTRSRTGLKNYILSAAAAAAPVHLVRPFLSHRTRRTRVCKITPPPSPPATASYVLCSANFLVKRFHATCTDSQTEPGPDAGFTSNSSNRIGLLLRRAQTKNT